MGWRHNSTVPFSGDSGDSGAGGQGVWGKGCLRQRALPRPVNRHWVTAGDWASGEPVGGGLGPGPASGTELQYTHTWDSFRRLPCQGYTQACDGFGSLRISWFGRYPLLLPVASLGPQIPQTQQGLPDLDRALVPSFGTIVPGTHHYCLIPCALKAPQPPAMAIQPG